MAAPTAEARGGFGSKMGFVLAAAGSAIGLGNIWRFPVETAQNGGAAFVIVYLACVFAIGIPVMIAELSMGRKTRSNPVGAFEKLAPRSLWKAVGGLGVLTGLMILSAYAVVAGWILKYLYWSATGAFGGKNAAEVSAMFAGQISSAPESILLHGLFLAVTVLIVIGGVAGGIERASKLLMPFLFALLVLLSVRAATMPGASEGLGFYLNPDFSKIDFNVVMAALGQAFFSLSLGMGAMITYGSYLSRRDNLVSSAAIVCTMDAGIAILAGFVIFPALFSFPSLIADGVPAGPGLIFVVLPNIFNSIPAGQLFGTGFFFLVAIAAVTSTISLLEVVVAYFIDEKGWPRRKAAIALGFAAFLLGIPSALGNGAVAFFSGAMDFVFDWFGEFALVAGALALCLFVTFRWGVGQALAEIREGYPDLTVGRAWSFMVRVVCPLAIAAILASKYIVPMFAG